jgi:hypothetical protein
MKNSVKTKILLPMKNFVKIETWLSMLLLFSSALFLTSCEKDEAKPKVEGEYALGDKGPAGGFIFYINPNYQTDGWRYLEAAPADLGEMTWGTVNFAVQGAKGTAVGTGEQNTMDIVVSDPSDNTAADACANYSIVTDGVTYDDWFLPSRDELEEIFNNLRLKGVGNFYLNENNEYEAYWTSSQADAEQCWGKCFETLITMGGLKEYPLYVRPVRAF